MLSDNVYRENQKPSSLTQKWHIFHHNPISVIGLYGFLLLIILCLFGKWFLPHPMEQKFLGYQQLPPSWSHYGDVSFFLGTDNLGRDILSRLLAGTTLTFGSALLVTILASLIGLVLGVLASSVTHCFRAMLLNHMLDTVLSIPSLLLAIIVVAFLGPRLDHAMLAVCLPLLLGIMHSIYTLIKKELEKDYVLAVRMDGASMLYILRYAVLPNITSQLISEFSRALSIAILDISALGFLNLGAQTSSPEWGAMMNDQFEFVCIAPWSVMLPGFAIMLSVMIVNIFSEGLCRAIVTEVE
ncbi:putrescine export ABC transporter permease SapC [Candidatus Steffania adelgidicola]|uniref:putrescine export ABC transporter permease SapC n=1 Tax=Candidatus Steffania adelgidicola TaxID=1076626 RepID=UPI001D020C9F|nr:putrescine export ABC transporter permease SapC [Candidatus Steffania adelgidicola]UDG79519.1 Putrescine export system permease protein SapC [Candidatus Steffania adelgidicola]